MNGILNPPIVVSLLITQFITYLLSPLNLQVRYLRGSFFGALARNMTDSLEDYGH